MWRFGNMDEIKIVSLNTRGLRNYTKRKKVFRFLKRNKANIMLLQETHCSVEVQNMWENEFGKYQEV